MAKKTPRRTTSKGRRSLQDERFTNYVHACEPFLVKGIFKPACYEILSTDGARSLSDLHVRLQNHLKMSISLAAFVRLMNLMPEIKALFGRQEIIRIPLGVGLSPSIEEIKERAVKATVHEGPQVVDPDDDGLREGLAPPPGGADLPADIPPRRDWDLSGLGFGAPVG